MECNFHLFCPLAKLNKKLHDSFVLWGGLLVFYKQNLHYMPLFHWEVYSLGKKQPHYIPLTHWEVFSFVKKQFHYAPLLHCKVYSSIK